MNWDDSAYLVSKNRYSENSIIAEVFTENHGKISGIIFGGTSKKIKNYLQLGNKVFVNFNSKSENMFYPALEAIFGRRIHWFQWIGITCGLISIYFSFRNYYLFGHARNQERGIVGILARIFGRNLD